MDDDVLIKADGVSKRYCRSLKRSLWYGAGDIARDLSLFRRSTGPTETSAERLRKDEFWALQDVSFELRRGECLGLIGHNGAGKSTLLKILTGLIKPDAGRITMRGRVGALLELSAGFSPILTGRENIYARAALLGFDRAEVDRRFDDIVDFAELDDFIDAPVQNYSSGMRVRLGFAVSAHMQPDILLLDEVLAVGDAAFRLKCFAIMAEMLERSAVIFVSHSMSQIHRVCTSVAMMKSGRFLDHGESVSRGIEAYFSEMPRVKRREVGSDGMRLIGATIHPDIQRTAVDTIRLNYGDPLQIVLELDNYGRLDSCGLSVVAWNAELYPVANLGGPDGHAHRVDLPRKERFKLTLDLDATRLSAGRYQLSLHILEASGVRGVLRVDNLFSIVMGGAVSGQTSYAAVTQLTVGD